MEPKGFPYEPVLLAFAVGILAGIWRGIQARAKRLGQTAREQMAALMRKNSES